MILFSKFSIAMLMLLLFLFLCCTRVAGISPSEAKAMISVLDAISLMQTRENMEADPCVAWQDHVECDQDGSVIKIEFRYDGIDDFPTLNGTISTEIGKLSNLVELTIAHHKNRDNFLGLYGTLPTELSQLTLLDTLHVDQQFLTGNLSRIVNNLTRLTLLDAGDNEFGGTLDEFEWAKLVVLKELSLDKTQLSGTIPTTMKLLSKLKELDLGDNDLTGTIPFERATQPILARLRLRGNRLGGSYDLSLNDIEDCQLGEDENDNFCFEASRCESKCCFEGTFLEKCIRPPFINITTTTTIKTTTTTTKTTPQTFSTSMAASSSPQTVSVTKEKENNDESPDSESSGSTLIIIIAASLGAMVLILAAGLLFLFFVVFRKDERINDTASNNSTTLKEDPIYGESSFASTN